MSEGPLQCEILQSYPAIIMTFHYKLFSVAVKTLPGSMKENKILLLTKISFDTFPTVENRYKKILKILAFPVK